MKSLRTTGSVLGWYFAAEDERLRHGDGRKIEVGVTHEVSGPPLPCWNGLHASETILDALGSAPGPILYRVELFGEIARGRDQFCATKRRYLARVDVTPELRAFARACALDVIDNWTAPKVVKDYLRTGDEALRSEAWSAAWHAAESAAWHAAYSAVKSAAVSATSAAEIAAWGAAMSAAASASWDAARSTSWGASWDAVASAKSAAWNAAKSMQARRLNDMVMAIPGHRVQIIG